MARKPKDPSPAGESSAESSTDSNLVQWKFTKMMNMGDLSRDDDYLSHLFVEKVGIVASAPLLVHKMDPTRKLPKTDATLILDIVQRLVRARPSGSPAIKHAVNDLLSIQAVQYFIRDYQQQQINAFATHASRYLELYSPNGSIEIAQTSRYSKWTGKSELCILATRSMTPGYVISELKGSMADLTDEEDRALKRTDSTADGGPRRDFSVIHSKQMKKNHLFLGPARFVNHDCDNNCELFRNGRYITFRAIKPIQPGQEITAHYGDGYFGRNNRHCLCETCEKNGRGGYAPQEEDDVFSDRGSDSDSDTPSEASVDESKDVKLNVNQRSTRRGVYLVIPDSESDSEDSETEVRNGLAGLSGQLTPLPSTPECKQEVVEPEIPPAPLDTNELMEGVVQQLSRLPQDASTSTAPSPTSEKSPFKSVITTRSQKARAASATSTTVSHLATPPLSASTSGNRSVSRGRRGRVSNSVELQQTSSSITDSPSKRGRGRPRKQVEEGSTSVSVSRPTTKSNTPSVDSKRGLLINEQRNLRLRKPLPSSSLISKNGSGNTQDVVGKVTAVIELQKTKEPEGPTCMTCNIVLPISEEASISAGMKRKRKMMEEKQECVRCKRHHLIYGAPWPHRHPTPGSAATMSSRETTPSVRDFATAGRGRKRHCPNDNHTPSTSDRRFLAVNLPSATSSDRSTPFQGTVSAWIEEMTQAIFEGKRILKMPGDVADRVVKKGIAMFEEKEEEVARREGREYRPGKWRRVVPIEVLERYGHLFEELFGKVVKVEEEEGEGGLGERESKKRKSGGGDGDEEDEDEEGDDDDMQVEDIPSTPEFITVDDDDDDDTDDRRDKEFWPTTTTTATMTGVPPCLPPPGSGMKRLGALTMRPSPINVSRWRCSPLRNSCYSSVEGTPTLVDDDTDNDNTSSSSSSSSLEDHTLASEEGAGEGAAVLTELQVVGTGTGVEEEEVPVSPRVELVALMQSDTEDEGVADGGGAMWRVGKGDVGAGAGVVGVGVGIGKESERDGSVGNRNANRSSSTSTSSSSSSMTTLKGFGLSLRPNPLMLSKRTWAPRAAIIVDDVRDEVGPSGGGVSDALLATVTSTTIPRKRVVAPIEGVYYSHQYRGHRRSSKSRRMIDEMEELSGEEDVIMPGPPDSALYKLQSKVLFGEALLEDEDEDTHIRPTTPVRDRDRDFIDVNVTPKGRGNPTTPTRLRDRDIFTTPTNNNSRSTTSRNFALGDLHSEFLQTASPSLAKAPINLINAGWESDCSV